MVSFNFKLLGLYVMAHLARLRSRCAHSKKCCNLLICGWIFVMLFVMLFVRIVSSFAYVVVLHVALVVSMWYPMLSFFTHCNRGSRKIFGLSVSPCIVPLLIEIGGVVSKWVPWNEVVEFVYMVLT